MKATCGCLDVVLLGRRQLERGGGALAVGRFAVGACWSDVARVRKELEEVNKILIMIALCLLLK